jgi:hypothetical protein
MDICPRVHARDSKCVFVKAGAKMQKHADQKYWGLSPFQNEKAHEACKDFSKTYYESIFTRFAQPYPVSLIKS